jgi:hypothetical protein
MNDNIEITVKRGYSSELKITLDSFSGIEEYGDVFRTILTFLTFHPSLFNDVLRDEYDESPLSQENHPD